MACSRGHFPLQCEYGCRGPSLGAKEQLCGGKILNVVKTSAPLKARLTPVLVKNAGSRTRALNVKEHEFDENFEEVGWSFGCARREIITGLIGTSFTSFGTDAVAADELGVMSKYIKRKKLDPLETYLPTILLAQSQFQEVDGKLDGEASKLADARSLLRNGPAASLRTDIRAVAQYAAESGNDSGASAAVVQCLRLLFLQVALNSSGALEDLDGLLLQASRSQGAPVEKMRQRLSTALTAIDRLLATVPEAILERGKAVAKAYMQSD